MFAAAAPRCSSKKLPTCFSSSPSAHHHISAIASYYSTSSSLASSSPALLSSSVSSDPSSALPPPPPPPSSSSLIKGTRFELNTLQCLSLLNFQLSRTGRSGDNGVDLLGHWQLTGQLFPVVVQCKNYFRKVT